MAVTLGRLGKSLIKTLVWFHLKAPAAQIYRALCYENILPNLINQSSSFHIFVQHEKSVNTMLDCCAAKLLAREERG